jgi:hypothetical protein
MTRVDFVFFDAGGGHRSAATALKSVIETQKRPWDVRLVNLQEVLRPLDLFEKVTGLKLEDVYNRMLAKGWTLGLAQALVGLHGLIRLYHRPMARLIAEHWRATRPDLVVSVVPNFNREMYAGLRAALPAVPYVTVLTDMADYPPHFWIERQEQDLVCGTERAVEQARALGHSPERIFRTSGMIIRPRFYEPREVDRSAERQRLGLSPSAPLGLVLFGGQGAPVMRDIARRLPDTPLILICGRNDALARRLRSERSRAPRVVLGFTEDVPFYMRLADFFIGKPGPGSISEAVAMGLPVIVERNARTIPQERYNADWVLEREVGVVLRNFRGIRGAVDQVLSSLGGLRANVARIQNRAVFEIPEILAGVLERG